MLFGIMRRLMNGSGRRQQQRQQRRENAELRRQMNPGRIDALALTIPPQIRVQAAGPNQPALYITPQNAALAAQYSSHCGGTGLVVYFAGNVIYEDYPNGGSIDAPVPLQGATQALIAPIILTALAERILQNLDEPACLTITEWAQDPVKSRITLRMLLECSCGLDAGDPKKPPAPLSNAIFAPPAGPEAPGTVFRWGPTSYQILGEVLRRRVPGNDLEAYIKHVLEERAGMKIAKWKKLDDGSLQFANGAVMTAREFGRIGVWLLRGCDGLVAENAIEDIFDGSNANASFGLGWWVSHLHDAQNRDVPIDLAIGAGRPATRIYVSHALQLMVVRVARKGDGEKGEKRKEGKMRGNGGAGPQGAHQPQAQNAQGLYNPNAAGPAAAANDLSDFSDTEFLNRLLFGLASHGAGPVAHAQPRPY
jgi:CubicO group peptidase (beta-lactamase class C family)